MHEVKSQMLMLLILLVCVRVCVCACVRVCVCVCACAAFFFLLASTEPTSISGHQKVSCFFVFVFVLINFVLFLIS